MSPLISRKSLPIELFLLAAHKFCACFIEYGHGRRNRKYRAHTRRRDALNVECSRHRSNYGSPPRSPMPQKFLPASIIDNITTEYVAGHKDAQHECRCTTPHLLLYVLCQTIGRDMPIAHTTLDYQSIAAQNISTPRSFRLIPPLINLCSWAIGRIMLLTEAERGAGR